MRIEEIKEKLIYGISTRTKNIDEMNPQTAKIGAIWQKFDNSVDIDYKGGERVYGVYYNYESDANSEFDVLAGCETYNEKLASVKIEKGKYLVYEENNDNSRVQAVIETWGKIWEYLSNENSQYKRAYKTDFEYYKNQNEIEIYISIF